MDVDVGLPAGAEAAALRTAAARPEAAGSDADTSTSAEEGAWHSGPDLWVAEARPSPMTISAPCCNKASLYKWSIGQRGERE